MTAFPYISVSRGIPLFLLLVLLVPRAEATEPAGRAGSGHGNEMAAPGPSTTSLDTLLAKAAFFADSNSLGQARGILASAVGGKPPTAGSVAALASFFSSLRMHAEGAEAMRGFARYCAGDALAAARLEEGRALIRSGSMEEGIALLETSPSALSILKEIENAKAIQKVMQSAIITETVAFRENLDACARSKAPVPEVLKLIRTQGEQIFLREDGIGVEASEVVREETARWPQAVDLQAALDAEAEKAGALLPGGDLGKFVDYWRIYRGTRPARQAGEVMADHLLNGGRPEVAMSWYGRLMQDDGNARLAAKYAYARSLTSATGSPADWVQTLSETMRKATVDVPAGWKPQESVGSAEPVNRALSLGGFIAGLPVKPPESATPSFPARFGLTQSWKAPIFPSEDLLFNRSLSIYDRTAFARPVIQPAASGNAVFVNTGLSIRRYAAESGSNTWTHPFTPEVVDDVAGYDMNTPVPQFPATVFGALVRDDLVVCRHVERMTDTGLPMSMGLTAVDANTGGLRWRSRDIPDLAGWLVASEPSMDRGLVTFLIRRSSGETITRAVGIEAGTGTVVWNRILVMGVDRRIGSRVAGPYGFELPRPLPVARGVCFATHMGWVFLLDALTGSVLWSKPYARAPDDNPGPRGLINPLLAAGGAIITAPGDSARIFAMDAATGKTLWDEPASHDPFLGGICKGGLVTFGRGLRLRDVGTGATVASVPLAWSPDDAAGFVNGDRFWMADEREARLYDLTTLKQADAVAAGQRLLPAGGMAIAFKPNVISTFRFGATDPVPVAQPGRTVRLRAVPADGAKRGAAAPAGDVAPRLLWVVSHPGFFSVPDEDRGLVLVHGFYNARLIDGDGFGEPYWEYLSTGIIRRVIWTDEAIVLGTDGDLIGLDFRTGVERWRHPTAYSLQTLHTQGDLFVIGTNGTEVLRVNPKDGGVRWRCSMPGNHVAQAVRETGGRLYVELNYKSYRTTGWSIRELGADGRLGRELGGKVNSRKDRAAFVEVGEDRVYTREGAAYQCWDPERKTMLWKKPFLVPGDRAITSKRVIPSTPAGHPWWYLSHQVGHAVIDPLTGECLYTGGGATWNSDVLEFSGRRFLTRLNLTPDKAPRKMWTTALDVGSLMMARWPESGAALNVVTVGLYEPFHTRLAQLDPATGKILRTTRILPAGWEGNVTVDWKYGNRRILLATHKELVCVDLLPTAGASDWYAGRRQAALRIADPAGRARALRLVNLSEQVYREAETRWLPDTGPLVLDQPWQWIPDDTQGEPSVMDWAGAGDLSARLTAMTTNSATLQLVVDVTDDHWVPMEGDRGDAIRIGDQVTVGLGPRFRPVINAMPAKKDPIGGVTVSAMGNSRMRYTIQLPPSWRNDYASSVSNTQFNLNLSVRDDDGQGVKGAMEWARCIYTAPVLFQRR